MYKTVLKLAEAQLTEKKSRFIGTAVPVVYEADALRFIDEMKKKYKDATHNVFAYRISGPHNVSTILERLSDDGEPSGTAGLPILDVLRGRGLTNTVVVVTRYFGGTLLGTGGLVRAYGGSAGMAVEAAGIIEKVLYKKISVTVSYSLSGKVQYEILQADGSITDTFYTDNVEFIVLTEDIGRLLAVVRDITAGSAVVKPLGDIYCAFVGGETHYFDD